MSNILTVSHLKKSYRTVQAVNDISFYVEKGAFFAFLGPNGAGKSTTIDMLCTLLEPDSGQIELNGLIVGKDDAQIRSSIGVVFQDSLLDKLLTVRENLIVRGGFYGLSGKQMKSAVERAAEATGILEFIDRRYGELSGGQRRRADIARALVHTPKILFLDEPTTGLDPQTRKSVWETIHAIQKESRMTVFLTTHYMEEAEYADYITVIDHGVISAQGSPSDLKIQYSTDYLKMYAEHLQAVKNVLDKNHIVCEFGANSVNIPLANTMEAIPILQICESYITNFEVRNGTMDDAFIKITGEAIRGE
jgi:multidrug/hemolysin transport system ATP-binding protein